MKSSGR